jgi:hypothetical protein
MVIKKYYNLTFHILSSYKWNWSILSRMLALSQNNKKLHKSFLENENWTFIFVHFLFLKKTFVKNMFCDHK